MGETTSGPTDGRAPGTDRERRHRDDDGRGAADDGEGAAADADADAGAGGDGGTFPRPPLTATDDEGRTVEVRPLADGDRPGLQAMYESLGPADRAQGLPPPSAAGVRSWLSDLLAEGLHLVALDGDRTVGHACLLPTDDGHELAIFVAGSHQQAGIGTALLRALLGHGAANGVERVWLTVKRDNVVARNLYESAGFERVSGDDAPGGGGRRSIEMERPL